MAAIPGREARSPEAEQTSTAPAAGLAAPAVADEAPAAASDGARPVIRAGNDDLYVEARGEFGERDVAGYVPGPESDALRVEVAPFEGPLDLLLHLIQQHALDIFDIPIKVIVAAYMKALDDMRELNLDVAGEFLMMAAQLAHIKSKMLLPKEERPREPEPELDPRADLVRRLLEYQRFKDAALRLGAFPQLGRDVFARPTGPLQYDGPVDLPDEDVKASLNLEEIEVFELIRALDQMLKKQQKLVVHEVMLERLSVGARINELVDHLVGLGEVGATFASLVDHFGGRTRRNVIVTFLSVLEMVRLRLLRIVQRDDGSIEVHPVLENLRADEGEGLTRALATVDEFEAPASSEAEPSGEPAAGGSEATT